MPHPEHNQIPSWAERERFDDLYWIGENLHIFWPVAHHGFEELGRGAIVVDTSSRPTGVGHPFGYFPRESVEEYGDQDTLRMIREYDPTWELVTVLLKPRDRSSTYRIGVPSVIAEQ
mgnify:CR=1 FL=1